AAAAGAAGAARAASAASATRTSRAASATGAAGPAAAETAAAAGPAGPACAAGPARAARAAATHARATVGPPGRDRSLAARGEREQSREQDRRESHTVRVRQSSRHPWSLPLSVEERVEEGSDQGGATPTLDKTRLSSCPRPAAKNRARARAR